MSRALGDISTVIMGQSPKGGDCNSNGKGVPLLNGPTEFKSHHPLPVQWTTAPKKLSKKNDLLFCVRGSTTGRMNWADQEYAIGRGLAAISVQIQGGEHFLKAVVEYNLPGLLAGATGSTFPNVSKKDIEDLPILVNSDIYIKAASALLKVIDDKIELNRKMNETLEEIAKAIFKSWFVDFDPVRAKMEGRPTGLPDDIAALFPDRLVDSEIGEIPEGWEVRSLDEIGSFLNGLALQKFPASEGQECIPVVKIAQLRKGNTLGDELFASGIDQKYVIDDGDFIFSWSGSLLAKYWVGGRGALNQHLFKVEGNKAPLWFVAFWVQIHLAEFRQIAESKATTMGHIKREHLSQAKCLVGSDAVIDLAQRTLTPFIKRSILAEKESRTLADLRDTLLPKLISGELQVPDAEKFLEEAGV